MTARAEDIYSNSVFLSIASDTTGDSTGQAGQARPHDDRETLVNITRSPTSLTLAPTFYQL